MVICGEFLELSRGILRAVVGNEDFRDAMTGKDALEVGDDLCCGSSAELSNLNGILCVSNHVTHAYAHAHFSNKRVIRELRIVSCPGGRGLGSRNT